MVSYYQGDVIKIEGINALLLVVSKDYYNENNQVIVCPLVKSTRHSSIYQELLVSDEMLYALCDQLKQFDTSVRGSKKIGQISIRDRMQISDIIQGLFEY